MKGIERFDPEKGFRGYARTVEEVAASLKLTRDGVRQIEAKAIGKMRSDPAIQSQKCRFLGV